MSKFIAYLPAGYPNTEQSIEGFKTLIDAGADILEIGIPYSDPVMDGIVIQNATKEAINNGFKIKDVFYIIKVLNEYIALKIKSGQLYRSPEIYIMSYYNPILKFGLSSFIEASKNNSVTGLIIPDLIPDEAGNVLQIAKNNRVKITFLTALNSSDERLDIITKSATGFCYASALLGTTGVRENKSEFDKLEKLQTIKNIIQRINQSQIRSRNWVPIYVGLGVSSPDDAREISEISDGVIVGSALVKAFGSGLNELYSLASELANAIR